MLHGITKGGKLMKPKHNSIHLSLAGLVIVLSILLLGGCAKKADNKVIIFASAEDYRVEHMQKRFAEEFPDLDITVEYLTTGNHAAKLMAELTKTECDITYDLEYGYLNQIAQAGGLAKLTNYDLSIFTDDTAISEYYLPELRNGGSIIINPAVLAKYNLAVPASYQDLLKPEYKNLISMANPKSSGTGYMFLKSLVNAWGEDAAFTYFEELTKNILQYTSSGSGPVNALLQGEVAIGLGMTAQAVTKINDGADLKILFFDEGSPYSLYGLGIINGKENKEAVQRVFNFLYTTIGYEMVELFYPERIYKDTIFEIENYPQDINYADMSNDTIEEKQHLLARWNF